MRILLANEFWPPDVSGGTELFLGKLRGWLEDRGHEVRVVAARYRSREDNALRVSSSPVRFRHFYQWPLLTAHWNYHNASLTRRIREFGSSADVFHLNNIWHLGMSPLRAARELGKPVLLDVHDWWPVCFRKDLMYRGGSLCPGPEPGRCSRCLFRTAILRGPVGNEMRERSGLVDGHPTFAHSSFVAKRLGGATVVPYCYDGEISAVPRDPPAGRPLNVLFLGRLQKNKGADMLDGISASLGRKGVRHRIDVGGTGPVRPHGPDIRLHGFVQGEAKRRLLELADVLIVPSRWPEPFGMVVLEAMANGIPVVAGSVGGLGELVETNRCGLTAAPDSDGLAEAVSRIAGDSSLYSSCSAAGLRNIRLYGKDRVFPRYEKAYSDLAGSSRLK